MNATAVNMISKAPPLAATRVLVVDDERNICKAWKAMLGTAEFDVLEASNAAEALRVLNQANNVDVVVTDVMMPGGMDGLELLKKIKADRPAIEVIVMTARGSISDAVKATKGGAFDYLTKPFGEIEECINKVRQAARIKKLHDENRILREQVDASPNSPLVSSSNPAMQHVQSQIAQVARVNSTVLITGPTGSGKSVIARSIHDRSPRKSGPFVNVDCGTIPETLIEAELFGAMRGSFTGAEPRAGLFEEANGGTIFLDEIGNMPVKTQASLLRAVQEGVIRRVGGTKDIKVDVRVISATNSDLRKGIEAQSFREDLFFRLKVVEIKLPPLNDRREDIPKLAYHFLRRHSARIGKDIKTISQRCLELLKAHDWKGNVRELDNVVEAATVFETSFELSDRHLPVEFFREGPVPAPDLPGEIVDPNEPLRVALEKADAAIRCAYLTRVMKRFRNVSAAARHAQVDRANFRRLLKRYNIEYESGEVQSDDDDKND